MAKILLKENSVNVLKYLKKSKNSEKPVEARVLCSKLKMEYEILMTQAVYELQTNNLVSFTEKKVTEILPTEELKDYIKNGLPERRLYNMIRAHGDEYIIEDFKKESNMDQRIFFIGLTNMKKNKWAKESKAMAKPTIFVYDKEAPKCRAELLLDKFREESPLLYENLSNEFQDEIKILTKRKLVSKNVYTQRDISLTKKGMDLKLSDVEIKGEEIARITPEMIADGSWKEKLSQLKPYEVENAGPRINAGKLHPMTIILNQIREIFLSMGFIEIKGPITELAFYNFDSLYQPQDHPAREMHDTFYLSNPDKGKLPPKKYVEAVKSTHEDGGSSGSTGWGYKWDENIAKKTLLRTHTTATTIRRLSKVIQNKENLPLKVFSIDRVFRNEKVDRTHLAEFMQVEGIVIGENVNLSQLRGILTEFYRKMGFPKIITRPGFFPYTEPSMEIAVFSESLGQWLEMGGSGIFRPEVSHPWGIKEPMRVLAWGQGFERLAMLRLGRKDIRDLYRSPLSWLRDVEYTKEEY